MSRPVWGYTNFKGSRSIYENTALRHFTWSDILTKYQPEGTSECILKLTIVENHVNDAGCGNVTLHLYTWFQHALTVNTVPSQLKADQRPGICDCNLSWSWQTVCLLPGWVSLEIWPCSFPIWMSQQDRRSWTWVLLEVINYQPLIWSQTGMTDM